MEEGHGESSSSSSSSDIGSNELPDQQNQPNSNHQDLITQTASSLLQAAGPLAIFESSAVPATIQHVGIPQLQQSNGAASHVLFPPSAVESSQPEIQLLNPEQDMGLILRNHSNVPSQNGDIQTEQEMSLMLRDHQMISNLSASRTTIHADHLVPSQTMGMVNHGYMYPIDQPIRNFANVFGSINTYHLPTSNLPPEFRLESSSRLQLPHVQQPPSQAPPESANGVSSFMKTQWTNWQPQNPISMLESSTAIGSSQEIQFQGLLNQSNTGTSNFYPSAGTTASQIPVPNLPIQQGMSGYNVGSSLPLLFEGLSSNYNKQGMQGNFGNSIQYEFGDSSTRPAKMKIPWQDNIPPSPNLQLASWISQGQGSQGLNFSTSNTQISRPMRNTVYDPMYEAMGLPVDPHLRMFVARRDTGNEDL
ncbi:uncharacterized protein LOC112490671 [Ziziphus jujuba]|uniref:Uncharacterized protein LOC112490671 n=1 Tax=Ziziphus jujuba TaxID=326968 RepID=A0A6P6FXF1_ZIZJJ|nr:uncharacterized protein LOC112490671 [Ziziphus jujuba]